MLALFAENWDILLLVSPCILTNYRHIAVHGCGSDFRTATSCPEIGLRSLILLSNLAAKLGPIRPYIIIIIAINYSC